MKKIYILDDSKIVTELLKFDLIREFNCEVLTFDNGNDLIDSLPLKPDVIILDHYIDNKLKENGLTILNKIRVINKFVPVIIFTGQHDLKIAIDFIHAGAIDYIDKNEDTFLLDLNNAIRNIFEYTDTVSKLSKIKKKIITAKKQIFGLGIFCSFLLLILYILQKLNIHFLF